LGTLNVTVRIISKQIISTNDRYVTTVVHKSLASSHAGTQFCSVVPNNFDTLL